MAAPPVLHRAGDRLARCLALTVPPGDGRAIEALARYCLRTSVSLTRFCLTADFSTVDYLAGGGHDDAPGQTLDA